jgi:hypothetical protein
MPSNTFHFKHDTDPDMRFPKTKGEQSLILNRLASVKFLIIFMAAAAFPLCSFYEAKGAERFLGGEWKLYDTNRHGSLYYDQAHLTRPSKGIVRVGSLEMFNDEGRRWVIQNMKNLNKSTRGYETLSHGVIYYEINCERKMYNILGSVDYAEDGTALFAARHTDENWTFIVPDSITERLYKAMCQ